MEKISRLLLSLLLVVSPLLLASNRPIFWAVNGCIICISFLCLFLGRSRLELSWKLTSPDGMALWLFLSSLIYMTVQWLPTMPSFLTHPIWASVPWASPRITIDSGATFQAIIWWLAILSLFVAMAAANRSSRISNYLMLISAVGLGEALFGLANAYYNFKSVGLLEKTAYEGWLTATFINRNSAASFFAICLSALTALTIQKYRIIDKEFARKGRVSSTFLAATSGLFYYLAVLFILFIAVLLTGSRAGTAAAVFGPFIVWLISTRNYSSQKLLKPVGSLVLIATFAIGTNALLERANGASSSAQSRLALNSDTLDAIYARPLLGHGAGAYQFTNPLYHSDSTPITLVWDKAHNSYLEAAADLGVPFTLLWLAGFATLCVMLWRKMRANREFQPASAVFFALVITEGLHASVDFSLQMQAIAIYAATITGLAIGECLKASKSELA